MRLMMTMLTLACVCGPIDEVPSEEPFHAGIVVEARLNGRGPFKLLLDTGSSHSAISEDLAKALGAIPVQRALVVSPIGQHVRTIVRLDRVEIGPTTTNDVFASVIPAEAASRMRGFLGLIGQDVLGTKRYTIDFRLRRVLWDGQTAATSSQALPLELNNGRVLVFLPQRAMVLRLVPDSATETLVLFRHRNQPLPPWSDTPAEVELATLLDRRHVQRVTLSELRIGGSVLLRLPATVVPAETTESGGPPDDPPVCDGLLPLHLFERVTFDGPGRLMFVERPRIPVG
jgi:hypothetical protein